MRKCYEPQIEKLLSKNQMSIDTMISMSRRWGLGECGASIPGDKSPGYTILSLRDRRFHIKIAIQTML
jgi:hypothetical protein